MRDEDCAVNDPGLFLSLYGAVLRLCPRDFRGRYGADHCDDE